jgi:hypothetical protein
MLDTPCAIKNWYIIDVRPFCISNEMPLNMPAEYKSNIFCKSWSLFLLGPPCKNCFPCCRQYFNHPWRALLSAFLGVIAFRVPRRTMYATKCFSNTWLGVVGGELQNPIPLRRCFHLRSYLSVAPILDLWYEAHSAREFSVLRLVTLVCQWTK